MSMDSFFKTKTYQKATKPRPTGDQLRDEGMQLVLDNNPEFAYQYFHYVLAMPEGRIFLNEHISRDWKGVWAKPQAWSSACGACIKRGLIEHHVLETKMEKPSSHSRKTHWLIRTGKTAEYKKRKAKKT
jgi:hypothetical protein